MSKKNNYIFSIYQLFPKYKFVLTHQNYLLSGIFKYITTSIIKALLFFRLWALDFSDAFIENL